MLHLNSFLFGNVAWALAHHAAGPVLRMLGPACLVILTLTSPAPAHETRPLIATLTVGTGTLDIVVSLNLEAALAGIGPEHQDTEDSPDAAEYDRLRALDAEALRERLDAGAFADLFALRVDGDTTPLTVEQVEIPGVGDMALPRISEIVLRAPLDRRAGTVNWAVDPMLGDSVVRLTAEDGEVIRATFVGAGSRAAGLKLDGARRMTWSETAVQYIKVGFVHIVPKGLDHILFVVALFLLSTRLSALLWQVSAFTMAHTVTLALGATGALQVSPSVVEPLIALSIAWVAVENVLTGRLHVWRPVLIFCFGLLHGLGFAGVLGQIGLPDGHFVLGLLAFNVGVELGQIAVIALCFALVGWASHGSWYRRTVVVPGSLAIAAVAIFWVVERSGAI